MPKRTADDSLVSSGATKRPRLFAKDHISTLSDELLLRIFSFVPVEVLTLCQSVSHRFQRIAGDNALWKLSYSTDFVQPRMARLYRKSRQAHSGPPSSSLRITRWLEGEELVRGRKGTDWKRQYKIRHRWSRGLCSLEEMQVASQPPVPPLVARMLDGIVYSADTEHGLRVWSYRSRRRLLAIRHFHDATLSVPCRKPLSISVHRGDEAHNLHDVAIGFQDGTFSIYRIQLQDHSVQELYTHTSPNHGPVTAIAASWPYLLTVGQGQILSLYYFRAPTRNTAFHDRQYPVTLLSSLQSESLRCPMSLSLRRVQQSVIANVAFCVPTVGSGWSTGIQELRFSEDGDFQLSRLVHAPLEGAYVEFPQRNRRVGAAHASRVPWVQQPTSISYSHPYLLMSHADNTLTVHLVTSTPELLKISPGTRLWGHTSAVFGAHVGPRGRAVSVSSRGEEVRVWQLEGVTTWSDPSQAMDAIDAEHSSVQLTPAKRPSTPTRLAGLSGAITNRGNGLGLAVQAQTQESVTRGWVGFDEENVVVLKEHGRGRQALVVYDFG